MKTTLNIPASHANNLTHLLENSGIPEDLKRLVREAVALDAKERRQHYANVNPLGGPARRLESVAECLRAGDEYHEVLRDFGLNDIPSKP